MKHSLLLFHPARALLRTGVTAEQAALIGEELGRVDARALADDDAMMGAPSQEWLLKHFKNETMWEAQDLQAQTKKSWLHIVDVIDAPGGVLNLIGDGGSSDQIRKAESSGDQPSYGDKPWVIVN